MRSAHPGLRLYGDPVLRRRAAPVVADAAKTGALLDSTLLECAQATATPEQARQSWSAVNRETAITRCARRADQGISVSRNSR